MNKTQPNVVVFSLAVVALLLIPVNAMASVVTNVDTPINQVLISPCNGETAATWRSWPPPPLRCRTLQMPSASW
jgi:hypothetical protein